MPLFTIACAAGAKTDEEGRWYWADITMRDPLESFARFAGSVETASAHVAFSMMHNVASAELDLPSLGFPYGHGACLSAT